MVVAGLLLTYTLPNVIALRNALTLIGFVLVLPALGTVLRDMGRDVQRSVLVFAVLLFWTVFVAVFISEDPAASLGEWKGEWLPAGIAFLLGLAVFRTTETQSFNTVSPQFWLTLIIPLAVLMVVHLVWISVEALLVGSISPHFTGLSDHKANITYAASTLLPIVLAFAVNQSRGGQAPGRQLYVFVLCSGALVIASVITSGARNGVIVTGLAVLGAGVVMLIAAGRRPEGHRLRIMTAVAVVLVTAIVAWAGVKWDPRWQHFAQTVPVALDTENHREWLNPSGSTMPLTADGQTAEESAYQRVAWAKVGFGMLFEHPWGLEISRHTFHTLVVERYGRGSMSHSHNSIVDYGLNVGFPGLALWIIFIVSMVIAGVRSINMSAAVAAWALIFLVLLFFMRSLIDSIMRDHILEQFMLMSGILLGVLSSTDPYPLDAKS